MAKKRGRKSASRKRSKRSPPQKAPEPSQLPEIPQPKEIPAPKKPPTPNQVKRDLERAMQDGPIKTTEKAVKKAKRDIDKILP